MGAWAACDREECIHRVFQDLVNESLCARLTLSPHRVVRSVPAVPWSALLQGSVYTAKRDRLKSVKFCLKYIMTKFIVDLPR